MDFIKEKQIHPRPDDKGIPVTIYNPSKPTPLSAFDIPSQVAVVVPDSETPKTLNGIEVASWSGAPAGTVEWLQVA